MSALWIRFFSSFRRDVSKQLRLEDVKKLRMFEMSESGVASGRVCMTLSVGS